LWRWLKTVHIKMRKGLEERMLLEMEKTILASEGGVRR
jgi:hypothetical protein